jgi:hypothetical protein
VEASNINRCRKLSVGSCAVPFEPDKWTDMMGPIVDFPTDLKQVRGMAAGFIWLRRGTSDGLL